jgi:FtsH-binding integral membrane protein
VVVGLRSEYLRSDHQKGTGPLNSSQPFRIKVLLVLVCALSSVIAGTFAGILSYATSASVSEAVLYGGGAFVASMPLGMSVLSKLGLL